MSNLFGHFPDSQRQSQLQSPERSEPSKDVNRANEGNELSPQDQKRFSDTELIERLEEKPIARSLQKTTDGQSEGRDLQTTGGLAKAIRDFTSSNKVLTFLLSLTSALIFSSTYFTKAQKPSAEEIKTENKNKLDDLLTEGKKAPHIMAEAIARVIDVKSAREGKRKISSSDMKEVHKMYAEFKGERDEAIKMLKGAKSHHAYMQIAAHEFVYKFCAKGFEFPGVPEIGPDRSIKTGPPYVVHDIIEDIKGFKALVVKPKVIELNEQGRLKYPPMVIFQGTVPTNPHDIKEDFNDMLGAEGMESNIFKIVNSMVDCRHKISGDAEKEGKELPPEAVKFDVAGHSLGGTRAQRLVATEGCRDMVGALFTFQAPGVGDNELAESFALFQKTNIDGEPGVDRPIVIHTRTQGDIVPKVGGKHLQADIIIDLTHREKNLGLLEVHSKMSYSEEGMYDITTKTAEDPNKSQKVEKLRKKYAGFVVWLSSFFTVNNQADILDQRQALKEWQNQHFTQ